MSRSLHIVGPDSRSMISGERCGKAGSPAQCPGLGTVFPRAVDIAVAHFAVDCAGLLVEDERT